MHYNLTRNPLDLTTTISVTFSDLDLNHVRLDEKDRYILSTPLSEETPLADLLQNVQLIAYRIEQYETYIKGDK